MKGYINFVQEKCELEEILVHQSYKNLATLKECIRYRQEKKSPCPFSWGLFFFQNSDSRSSSSNLKEKRSVKIMETIMKSLIEMVILQNRKICKKPKSNLRSRSPGTSLNIISSNVLSNLPKGKKREYTNNEDRAIHYLNN